MIQRAIRSFHRGPGRCVRWLASRSRAWSPFPYGELSAVAIGVIPAAASFVTGLPGQQFISAVALSWLLLGTLPDDRRARGMSLLAIAFAAHCLFVIAVSNAYPAAEQVLPDAEEYWRKQQTWITTGVDPENEVSAWLPRHCALAAAAVGWSSLSLGLMTFVRGFYEVDLMNYYNGRLLAVSRHSLTALLLGWHPWSVLRGAGFLVLTWECTALGYLGWTGESVGTPRRRWIGWLVGGGLLIADGVVKALLMESVRAALARNLQS